MSWNEADLDALHPLEYAHVEGLEFRRAVLVYGTQSMTDDEILEWLQLHKDSTKLSLTGRLRLDHLEGWRDTIRIDRVKRCYTCDQWSPCKTRQQAETRDSYSARDVHPEWRFRQEGSQFAGAVPLVPGEQRRESTRLVVGTVRAARKRKDNVPGQRDEQSSGTGTADRQLRPGRDEPAGS